MAAGLRQGGRPCQLYARGRSSGRNGLLRGDDQDSGNARSIGIYAYGHLGPGAKDSGGRDYADSAADCESAGGCKYFLSSEYPARAARNDTAAFPELLLFWWRELVWLWMESAIAEHQRGHALGSADL